ncbi:23S rRNA (guanosine(2251)-2'-O)-methyltransferase RlmB [Thiomicrorhabdus xiamenensis]|uniref:23S rRNA (guanosine-2'-O-)-methyltransferase RlmB n=1 Tax=Thiomicrorhabdus xiamenensis TaxID=2739063 RepID=A0A7D4SSM7_9GAMM|nr:23S rRNA (guanosine(2251)-2'-O)-methyltransferase RlmB [Thiomicrorhabdus xiamenensis]QKI89603.1 23S rRNA (guanosine(2251)-2'-O)-methyltransferase RlmB [Thiomicrorhabdus xiamenensis]
MKQQLIFGIHAIERFIKQAPQSVFSISFLKGRLNPRQQALLDQARSLDLQVELVNKSVFAKIDGNHQGVMAMVEKQKDLSEADLLKIAEETANPLFVFLDEVQDPHNLGAILRTADAVGVDAVIIPKNQSVGVNATVRKVACGAADTVKLVVVTNLVRSMKELQQNGMWMIGLAGETDKTIYQQDFSGAIGIVMGAEGTGLRRLTREACDHLAAIPMVGSVESLNVSVATGVTLYEAFRQRNL